MSILIKNCRIISPDMDIERGSIEIEGDMIKEIHPEGAQLPDDAKIYDAETCMVVPGFIDVHTHGAMGFDVVDGTDEAIETIAAAKLKEGVTTFCPTTLTTSEAHIAQACTAVARYQADDERQTAKIPGVHLEGPFINPKFIGAQNPDFVRKPDIDEVLRLNSIARIMIDSYAIEMDDNGDFAAQLLANGIVPSCGHSAATYKQFNQAKANGVKHLTHFCNQMSPLHHREIGLVGTGLMDDEVMVEAICDKVHLGEDMIKLIFKIKPIEKISVITDSMLASGLPDGEFNLGGLEVILNDNIVRLKSNGALAGGTTPYWQALKNIYELTDLPLKELIKTTGYNQARELGLEKTGKIEPGFYADIAVLDADFKPQMVFVNGRMVRFE